MKYVKYIVLFVVILLLLGLIASGTYIFINNNDTDIPASLQNVKSNFQKIISPKNASYPSIKHIFVILEENHDWESIYKNTDAPYINKSLLPQGAYAGNYHNISVNLGELHPSELNYIFIEAGMVAFPDHTFTTDNPPAFNNSTSSQDHLVSLLVKNGYTWSSYQEGISGKDCPISPNNNYDPKHNPFVYFQDVSGNPPSNTNQYCQDHMKPLSKLKNDLAAGRIANYVFITPNLKNDMHDGTIAEADSWLSQIVPIISNSKTFKKDGALFITWDEGSETSDKKNDGNNPIGMIIESPFVKKNYTNTIAYSHASLLKTIEEIFNITPFLGLAKDPQTQDLFDFFVKNK